MGMLGSANRARPLECPDCGGKILWNGSQHVCISCSWKEHVACPPSDCKIPAVKKKRVEEEE